MDAEVIARFDRNTHEEVRISLTSWQGQSYLEFRVYRRDTNGVAAGTPQGLILPLDSFEKLHGAIEFTRDQLRHRGLLARAGATAPPAGAPGKLGAPPSRDALPVMGRPGALHGRAEVRVPLTCPVEYSLRGNLPRQTPERRQGQARDISRSGVQLVLPERISILSVLYITLHLPLGFLSLVSEVMWAELSRAVGRVGQGWRHGLRFREVGPQERHLLDRTLEGATG